MIMPPDEDERLLDTGYDSFPAWVLPCTVLALIFLLGAAVGRWFI